MTEKLNIFLPAGFKQYRILKSKFIFSDTNVLVIGAGSEKIAEKMIDAGAASVKMIVNDLDPQINSRLNLAAGKNVIIDLMEYDATDFRENEFDLVYAQGTISSSRRNKIVKEIIRILKTDGVFCVGEITALSKTYPAFIKNIFNSSDILPLIHDECLHYYEDKKFTALFEQDLSSSLRSFYSDAAKELELNIDKLSDREKSYYKKLLNKISHESNAYLKLGGDKYIGFKMLMLKLSGFAP